MTPEEKAYLEEMGPDRNFVGEDHIKCFEYSRLIYRYSDVFKIQMAINEIYARYGYRFHDPDIQAYFDAKDWYVGTTDPEDFDPSVLAYHDQYNINTALDVIEMRNNGVEAETNGHEPSFQYMGGTYIGDHGSIIEITPYEEQTVVEEEFSKYSLATHLQLGYVRMSSDLFDVMPELELRRSTGPESDGGLYIVNEDGFFRIALGYCVDGEKLDALYCIRDPQTGEELDIPVKKEVFIRDTEYQRLASE